MRDVTNDLAIGAYKSTEQFKSLFSTKASAKMLYCLSKHEDALKKHVNDYDKARIGICERLADQEDGKPVLLSLDVSGNVIAADAKDEQGNSLVKGTKYKITPENEAILQEELKDLLALEVECPEFQISIDDMSTINVEPALWPLSSYFFKYYVKD